jgi:hypothetical protein
MARLEQTNGESVTTLKRIVEHLPTPLLCNELHRRFSSLTREEKLVFLDVFSPLAEELGSASWVLDVALFFVNGLPPHCCLQDLCDYHNLNAFARENLQTCSAIYLRRPCDPDGEPFSCAFLAIEGLSEQHYQAILHREPPPDEPWKRLRSSRFFTGWEPGLHAEDHTELRRMLRREELP